VPTGWALSSFRAPLPLSADFLHRATVCHPCTSFLWFEPSSRDRLLVRKEDHVFRAVLWRASGNGEWLRTDESTAHPAQKRPSMKPRLFESRIRIQEISGIHIGSSLPNYE